MNACNPARPTKKRRKPSGYRCGLLVQVAKLQKAKAIIEEVIALRSTGFTEWFALCDITGAIDHMMSETCVYIGITRPTKSPISTATILKNCITPMLSQNATRRISWWMPDS